MSIAHRERLALADLLAELGPDAPTLCAGWDTRMLAAHLVVRERRPDATPGVAIKPLRGHTESVQAHYAAKPYDRLIHLIRTGPGLFSPFAVPGVDRFFNTTEYVVHHEDVRRAQPGWEPRHLPVKVQDALWRVVATRAPLAFRSLDCGVTLRRSDRDTDPLDVRTGTPTVELSGAPLELLLYTFGRGAHSRVQATGDRAAIEALGRSNLAV